MNTIIIYLTQLVTYLLTGVKGWEFMDTVQSKLYVSTYFSVKPIMTFVVYAVVAVIFIAVIETIVYVVKRNKVNDGILKIESK